MKRNIIINLRLSWILLTSKSYFNRKFKGLVYITAGSGLILSNFSCNQAGKHEMKGKPLPVQPNILWISCEDISPRLGCYGDNVAHTPNIDRLASQGIKYTNVYTSAPVCAPCRSGIITGMYQTSIGTHHMRTSHVSENLPTPYEAVPPHYVKTFTEYLRAAGYYCTNNVKTDYQFASPVTAWDECSNTAHYKNRPDKDTPFFAVFNFTITHESRNWQEPDSTDPSSVNVPPYYPDNEIVRKNIARLYDNIAKLDVIVGRMLKDLEDEGLADNTVVFFWSDHGDGLPRAKRWLYDSGTRIPLIIRWPGYIKNGMSSQRLISSIDFGPTVLSIAGVSVPKHMQGRAFLGAQGRPPRSYVFSARDRFDESYDMVRSVRDNKYRYIRNYYPLKPYVLWVPYRNRMPVMQELFRLYAEDKLEGAQKIWFSDNRPPEELYDCEKDPHQVNNLADDPEYKDVMRRMSKRLNRWMSNIKDMGNISESVMVNNMWPDGVQPVTAHPEFVIYDKESVSKVETLKRARHKYPAKVSVYCATQGASIAYTTDTAEHAHWKLYTGPIKLNRGNTLLRTKAIRYGYKESKEVTITFEIE
ncbi:MAG: sulfatase-like hydrolase/transferase [Bacteroidales bacterium]|nr:MAG: sulfatase-like hydrolase/transferase [Bacteroidales bacterium]